MSAVEKKTPAVLSEGVKDDPVMMSAEEDRSPARELVWRNVVWYCVLHAAALYSLALLPWLRWQTWLWTVLLYVVGALGVTAGAHRLWAHRSYRARLPLRILLAAFNAVAMQNDILDWARDHRVHHKYSETEADPHNARRGFFFSHVGWLMVRKHPSVSEKGRGINLDDLLDDPVVRIQRKYYYQCALLMCVVMPVAVPYVCWGESFRSALFVCFLLRYCLTLNATWCVNSIAHMWGMRPYDKNISPAESVSVALGALGEGFHNYHHTFPSDYSTSEYGSKLNLTTWFINGMNKLGLATDLRQTSPENIAKRKERTGDGTAGVFGGDNATRLTASCNDKVD